MDTTYENIFRSEYEKVAKFLFKDKETVAKNELEEIMKTYPHKYEADNKTIRAFDSSIITWGDINTAFANDEILTNEQLYLRLKKLFDLKRYPVDQSSLCNESIFNQEWEKVDKFLFKDRETVAKNELEEIMKTYPHKYEADDATIRAFGSIITWEDINTVFMDDETLTREELRIRLKNFFSLENVTSDQQYSIYKIIPWDEQTDQQDLKIKEQPSDQQDENKEEQQSDQQDENKEEQPSDQQDGNNEEKPTDQQPSDQQNTNSENIFNEEWEKLVNNLFENKKTITKEEIERTMRKNKINPNDEDKQNEKIFDSMFTWGSVLRAFDNKNEITIDELYKSISEEYNKK